MIQNSVSVEYLLWYRILFLLNIYYDTEFCFCWIFIMIQNSVSVEYLLNVYKSQ